MIVAVAVVMIGNPRRHFQRVWEGWKAGFMDFHAFHALAFPWLVFRLKHVLGTLEFGAMPVVMRRKCKVAKGTRDTLPLGPYYLNGNFRLGDIPEVDAKISRAIGIMASASRPGLARRCPFECRRSLCHGLDYRS